MSASTEVLTRTWIPRSTKTSAPFAEKKQSKKADKSAAGVAALRALSCNEADPLLRGVDSFARVFASPGHRLLLRLPSSAIERIIRFADSRHPGVYGYVNARTKHFDEVLLRSLDEGIQQLVILGAGYDSRAYRFRDRLVGVSVFELDLPATQARKKRLLARHHGELPANVTLVPIDFNSQRIEEALISTAFDSSKKTLFLWEGVSMYLTAEGVDQTLRFVARHAGSGSSILFDYMARSALEAGAERPDARRFKDSQVKMSCPFTFGIDENAIDEFLEERGFRVGWNLGPADLELAYLLGSDHQVGRRSCSFLWIIHAIIP
jgi:methyltransferase (TIGR00027 family)